MKYLISTFLYLAIKLLCCGLVSNTPQHTNVVIFGATGNLAKKYLWNGMFELHVYVSRNNQQSITFYGSSRQNQHAGQQEQNKILNAIKCNSEDCKVKKLQFIQISQYVELTTDDKYRQFCNKLNQAALITTESGRLFYFSVPPFAYSDLSKKVNSYCRPPSNNTWIRVVFEKPFGKDLSSAQQLSEELKLYFKEHEIYRIDHYLGKPLVRAILPFRFYNRELYDKLWNKDFIERVEIVMKESEDAAGRIQFYDQYGVIRDVMQNHLSELLVLIGMELPNSLNDIEEIKAKKLELISSIRPATHKRIVIGQYDEYQIQARKELNNGSYITATPTFAGIVLQIDNNRWQDIPFIIVSGKQLEARETYIKIIFKNSHFCLTAKNNMCTARQIIFHVGSGKPNFPAILISNNIPYSNEFSSWSYKKIDEDITLYDLHSSNYKMLSTSDQDAYTALILSIFNGEQNYFVGSDHLIALWKIWTPVLQILEGQKPRLYNWKESGWLDFSYVQNELNFINRGDGFFFQYSAQNASELKFKGNKLISGNLQVVSLKLATHILLSAKKAIKEKKSFHIGFSGGSSPERLLKLLIDLRLQFSWQYIHIWMVDERCVPLDDKDSNFYNIYNNLIKFIQIPYFNIHPMPVTLSSGICHPADQGMLLYENMITKITSGMFDFIVLGVGSDGHTASLFLNQSSLDNTRDLVILTKTGLNNKLNNRMSLTFKAINKAKEIAVLITGANKQKLVQKLQFNDQNNKMLPISNVLPKNGSLTWYIDSDVLTNVNHNSEE